MVINTVGPCKKLNLINTMSMYHPCRLRGSLSCSKCNKRRAKEAVENQKSSVKGTLLDAFRKAVNALDELDLVPRTKKPRECKQRPAVLTIYVRKRTEKGYNAIRLNHKSVEELQISLGDKYGFSSGSVTSFKLSTENSTQKLRIYNDLTEEMVEGFEDEDDFLLDLSYDIVTGICDVKLTKGPEMQPVTVPAELAETKKKRRTKSV